MPRVLIVALAFPPVSASGAHRTLGFATHLPSHGWEPVVLTLRDPENPALEPGLVASIPHGVPVIRTRWFNARLTAKRLYRAAGGGRHSGSQGRSVIDPPDSTKEIVGLRRRLLPWLIPDEVVGWWPFGVAAGLRAVQKYEVDAIYSTSPPPTSHLIALTLRRLTGRPWVAEFRDLWTENPYRESEAAAGRVGWPAALERRMERAVLRHADQVVTVSERLRDALAAPRRSLGSGSVHVITNGYEPEGHPLPSHRAAGCFTICFTGTFYAREYLPFLRALKRLLEAGEVRAGEMQVRIVGSSDAEVREAVEELCLDRLLVVSGLVPHVQALQEQVDASVLLLVVDEKGGAEGRLTGKVFEYLQARRPILALVPSDSEIGRLVRRTGAGTVVDPGDSVVIATVIGQLFREFQETGDLPWHGREEIIREYARPRLTGRLAAILDGMVASGARSPRPAASRGNDGG